MLLGVKEVNDFDLVREAAKRLNHSTELSVFILYYGNFDGKANYGSFLMERELTEEFRDWLSIQIESPADARQLGLVA